MTQEEKELLLKDLCARLPYEVQCEIGGRLYGPYTFVGDDVEDLMEGRTFKPYLRSMSSMTKEEKKEYDNFLFDNLEREDVIRYEDKAFGIDVIMRYRSWEVVQWLLEHHLDFNGLIDLGLAIEAPEGMYKTE